MELTADRDSICAGDDVERHAVWIEVPDDATLEQALAAVDATRFHHVHAGGLTSWLVRAGRNGRPLAAVRGHHVVYITDRGALISDLLGTHRPMLYFEHELGREPDDVRAEYVLGDR